MVSCVNSAQGRRGGGVSRLRVFLEEGKDHCFGELGCFFLATGTAKRSMAVALPGPQMSGQAHQPTIDFAYPCVPLWHFDAISLAPLLAILSICGGAAADSQEPKVYCGHWLLRRHASTLLSIKLRTSRASRRRGAQVLPRSGSLL